MVLAIVVVAQAVQNRSALVAASYIVIVPFTLIGAGKTGANHNHLLETMLGLSLAGGIALGWAMHELARARIRAIPIVALLALQLVLSFQPHQWFTGELTPHGTPERFVSFIQHTPGEILADNPALLYLAGKPMRYNDPSSMGPVVVVGLWDQSGLLEDIAQHRFSAILIPIDVEKETLDPSARWTPEMLSAIRDHYRVLFRDSIFVYAPK
jgi:hypothetical protein